MKFPANVVMIIISILSICAAESKLKSVNIIFRHGDRTPTLNAMFPTDPHYNSNFYPYGLGSLTSQGKSRTYKLGEFLRERYKNFLGDIYLPELLYARSTDYDRTKMSLQLVLAALFPPVSIQKWHDTLNWQPIPIIYVPKPNDDLLAAIYQSEFQLERHRVEMLNDVQKRYEKLHDFMTQLSNWTGKNISDSFGIKNIYDTLTSEKHMNLTLPEWASTTYFESKLLEGTLLDYDIITYDNRVAKALCGKLMSKITTDLLAAKNATENERTKLFLYSGHDINIVGILRALNVFETHVPEYSSAVIIELLEENNKHYIKVLYYHGIDSNLLELQIPECSVLCPFDKYLITVNDMIELTQI